MNIVLKSATILSPDDTSLHRKKRDILISKGTIEKIAAKIDVPKNVRAIDYDNLHVSTGWFDSGVGFGEPGYEERETIANGLNVAAASGFTDVLLNPNTNPTPDTSSDIIFLKERAKGFATNLHPIGNLTVGGKGQDLAELFDMQKAGAVAFYDFKHALSNPNLLKIALLYVQNFEGLVCSFPQNEQIKSHGNVNEGPVSTKLGMKGFPSLSEELQINSDLFVLEYTGGKLHIPTISSAKSVKLIVDAKKKGLDVTCSVALHNLFFTDDVLADFDPNFKVIPPLRSKNDQKALLKGLKDGTIDFVTTDHTPMDIEHKRVEFDNAAYGTLGLESAFGILNQLFSTDEAISLLTKGRERFGISVPKLKEGEKASITLFNPDVEKTLSEEDLRSTSKNSMFLGAPLKGSVYGVINNGILQE
ncbi:dihydroorotase [Allomuricauda sp. d1]|uniref:dihydroorotase n=1 Tax=Allomuricauda sp. d1 TaxID=3136725 RepID=UPI0031D3460B